MQRNYFADGAETTPMLYRGGQVVFVDVSPEEEQKTYAAHLEAIASLERQAEQISNCSDRHTAN